jgi:hypothetical protein
MNFTITGYSSSSTIIVGTSLYTNPELTTPLFSGGNYFVEGDFNCNTQTFNGIFTDTSGLVEQTNHDNNCGD